MAQQLQTGDAPTLIKYHGRAPRPRRLPEAFIDALVAEVKSRPKMWDRNHPCYQQDVGSEWDDIAVILNKDRNYLRALWNKMRNRLLVRLQREYELKGAVSEAFLNGLYLYPKIQFALDSSTLSEVFDNIDAKRLGTTRRGMEEEEEDPMPLLVKMEVGPEIERHEPEYVDDEREASLARFQNGQESKLDSEYLFLMSLLPSLKRIPHNNRMRLMMTIQNAVYEELVEMEGSRKCKRRT